MSSDDRAISSYSADALKNVSVAVFLSPCSGATDTSRGNLVDIALEKGVMCSIGWKEKIYGGEFYSDAWITDFFRQCALGYSVEQAALNADATLKIVNSNPDAMALTRPYRYCGKNDNTSSTCLKAK